MAPEPTKMHAVAGLRASALEAAAREAVIGDAALWRSLSSRPRLALDGELPAPCPGTFIFEADVMPVEGCGGEPSLCFDFGAGFDEAGAVRLGRIDDSPRAFAARIDLPAAPKRIRLDPCAGEGWFVCTDVRVRAVSATAAGRALRTGAIVHLFYDELWPEMARYLAAIPRLERLFVSIRENAPADLEGRIESAFPMALVQRFPNRGRDVAPFLHFLEIAAEYGIDLVCKVHTKRSPHTGVGHHWRRNMLDALLGSADHVRGILAAFEADPALGIAGPAGHVVPSSHFWELNAARVGELCLRMGRDIRGEEFAFVAGSMFWCRVAALLPLRRLGLRDGDFEPDAGLVDATLAHALERCFPVAAAAAGYGLVETMRPDVTTPLTLEALANVEACGADGEWRSTSDDPMFAVRGMEAHRGTWVAVAMQARSDERVRWSPCLYLDAGGGYAEASKVPLTTPDAQSGRSETILRVPDGLVSARFDPLECRADFRLGAATVAPLAPGEAAARMLEAIAEFGTPEASEALSQSLGAAGGEPAPGDPRLEAIAARYRALLVHPTSYRRWIEANEPPRADYAALAARQAAWEHQPLVSVVMPTYNSPERLLVAAIESVRRQLYPHWELCIADDASPKPHVRRILEDYAARDPRIKVVLRETNGHISAATNSALSAARGEFVALLDHDDELHPLALHYVAEAVNAHPGCELVFSDEDKIGEDGRRRDPYFKCDYNHDLLMGQNMISHLGVYRLATLREIGGFTEGLEGSQDYDLALRFLERVPESAVVHIPRVLYHWRLTAGSTSVSIDNKGYAFAAARESIQRHLDRTGVRGRVTEDSGIPGHTRVVYAMPEPPPLVSVIIPTRDRTDLLRLAVAAVAERCDYRNTEIVVMDNGSVEPGSQRCFDELRGRGVQVLRDDRPFNFSALNNAGARASRGELLLFLNNDIEPLDDGWLAEMVAQVSRAEVGAVGPKLLYPDGTIQHAGVILGLGGLAAHSHHGSPGTSAGYFGRAGLTSEFSAVTGACLLTKRAVFEAVGGFDEELPVAYNDIDLCLRIRERGLKVIYTPFARLVHNESATRGSDADGARRRRLEADKARMRRKWGERLARDPFYSPNLTLTAHGGFSLRWG